MLPMLGVSWEAKLVNHTRQGEDSSELTALAATTNEVERADDDLPSGGLVSATRSTRRGSRRTVSVLSTSIEVLEDAALVEEGIDRATFEDESAVPECVGASLFPPGYSWQQSAQEPSLATSPRPLPGLKRFQLNGSRCSKGEQNGAKSSQSFCVLDVDEFTKGVKKRQGSSSEPHDGLESEVSSLSVTACSPPSKTRQLGWLAREEHNAQTSPLSNSQVVRGVLESECVSGEVRDARATISPNPSSGDLLEPMHGTPELVAVDLVEDQGAQPTSCHSSNEERSSGSKTEGAVQAIGVVEEPLDVVEEQLFRI